MGYYNKKQTIDDSTTYQKKIRYRDVVIPSITIGTIGYTNITDYLPTDIRNKILFSLFWSYEAVQPTECVCIMSDGEYIIGRPQDTFQNVTIRHFYTD